MPFNLEELVRSVLGLELGERRAALPPLKANQPIAGSCPAVERPAKAPSSPVGARKVISRGQTGKGNGKSSGGHSGGQE